jgi:hypothetical protein
MYLDTGNIVNFYFSAQNTPAHYVLGSQGINNVYINYTYPTGVQKLLGFNNGYTYYHNDPPADPNNPV